eukprot:6052037-Amphidinium_carterae.1
MREVRSGGDQDHIVHILADFDLPSRTLKRAYQKSMQEVNGKTATWGQTTGALDSSTYRSLNKDASPPTAHVQRTVKGVQRKTSLNGKLFKLPKQHSLVAFRAVEENSSLMLPAGIPSLSLKGKVESFIQRALANGNFPSTSASLTPLLDVLFASRTPKSIHLRQ